MPNSFEEDINGLIDDTDGVVDIPLDIIDVESKNEANSIIQYLVNDKGAGLFEAHPDLKKYIDIEMEGLRTLIKMKRSNEAIHDVLIGAIGSNARNASLYRALTGMQSTILSIQKQMDDKVDNIKKLIKNYQMELELEFDDEDEESGDEQTDTMITRGTRDFIKQMKLDDGADVGVDVK